ncbi:MAG TPA: hypothetical protein VNJ02_05450 [Vicinamibacterales bacterium]|nr:hypothetical protein [Vicinamibacterales bacterium]
MNLKLVVGIALFVIGITTAVIGITRNANGPQAQPARATGPESGALEQALGNVALPAVAGLSLAIGGLLIGLSMGNWQNPRPQLEPSDRVAVPKATER